MRISPSSIGTKPDRFCLGLALIGAFVVAASIDCAQAELAERAKLGATKEQVRAEQNPGVRPAPPENAERNGSAKLVLQDSASADRAPAKEIPSLNWLINEALQNNPEIEAALREREAATQRVRPAGALDDPMLEAGVVNLPLQNWGFRSEDMTMKMIGLAQRFPYPGKRDLRESVAAREADTAAFLFEETINRVVREVKLRYFDLVLIAESARLTQRNKLVLEQFEKIAAGRYAVGQGSQADVLKAQTQISRMVDELIKVERERRLMEAELNRALGRKDKLVVLDPLAPQLHEFSLSADALRDAAFKDRPQLRAAQTTVLRNEKALELAQKKYYPDFDVRFAYGQRDRTDVGNRRDDMVSLTLSINLPIWRERKLAPRVAEAVAMRAQALSMLQAQQVEIFSQLRQQIASAEQNLASAKLYRNGILPQARLTVESALAAYRVNRVDFLTLLDNQMTIFNYEIGYATSLVNYDKALSEIEFVTGKTRLPRGGGRLADEGESIRSVGGQPYEVR